MAKHARPLAPVPSGGCDALPAAQAASCRRGEQHFFSPALSYDGRVACASCHAPASGFRDGRARPRARGVALKAPRTPSLVDVARTQGPFFWNGRAVSLQGQVFWPLYAKDELGATDAVLRPWGGAPAVAADITAFLETLSTPPAPFDAYVAGDCAALAPAERRGLQIVFGVKACTECHTGTEMRGEGIEFLRYLNIPDFAFFGRESSYSADAQLAEGGTLAEGGRKGHVTLGSVPQTLRNLHLRGPPWGRYGTQDTLEAFLVAHARQPERPRLRVEWSRSELSDALAFLLVGLRSEERE